MAAFRPYPSARPFYCHPHLHHHHHRHHHHRHHHRCRRWPHHYCIIVRHLIGPESGTASRQPATTTTATTAVDSRVVCGSIVASAAHHTAPRRRSTSSILLSSIVYGIVPSILSVPSATVSTATLPTLTLIVSVATRRHCRRRSNGQSPVSIITVCGRALCRRSIRPVDRLVGLLVDCRSVRHCRSPSHCRPVCRPFHRRCLTVKRTSVASLDRQQCCHGVQCCVPYNRCRIRQM